MKPLAALPAPRTEHHCEEPGQSMDPARRRAIARGLRFGHAALAYTRCSKLARPAKAPSLDICA